MFECAKPVLVLDTPTYHPVLNHHTGYIFQLYDFAMYKPRELFFQHYAEALVFANHIGAKCELDSNKKPERLTSEAYLVTLADDSRFMHMPDLRTHTRHGGQFKAKHLGSDVSEVSEVLDSPTLPEVDDLRALLEDPTVEDIDFFGGE